jgi:hypothetical protein
VKDKKDSLHELHDKTKEAGLGDPVGQMGWHLFSMNRWLECRYFLLNHLTRCILPHPLNIKKAFVPITLKYI